MRNSASKRIIYAYVHFSMSMIKSLGERWYTHLNEHAIRIMLVQTSGNCTNSIKRTIIRINIFYFQKICNNIPNILTIDKFSDITKGESSPAKVDSQESSQKRQSAADSKKEAESKGGEKKEEEEKTEREKAATRIQAAFRGHHARKSMKDIESSTKQTGTKSSSEPTKEQLQQEFRADDKGECHVPTLEIVPKGEPFNFTEISPFPANLVSRSSFVPSSRAKEFTTSLHSPLVCVYKSMVPMCLLRNLVCQETLHYFWRDPLPH